MNPPETVEDLELFIKKEVQESINLDYKDSRAVSKKKRHEIAKDVSAFANSDGGILIYGITEEQYLPTKIDGGVDHTVFTREWLEEVISSNISPTIDGLLINQIPLTQQNSVFVVKIPKSVRAPHQEQSSKRYYKRYNFKSQPMENYEIQDIRHRSLSISPLVNFDIVFEHSIMVYFQIENTGNMAAENVEIIFSKDLSWRRETPPSLKSGIRYFPVGKKIKYFYNTGPEIFKDENKDILSFDVSVKYLHPQIGDIYEDKFYIDFNDYLHSTISESELTSHGKKIEKCLKDLTGEIKKLNSHLENLSSISAPTGLDISITSLRSLKHIISGKGSFDKFDPRYCPESIFREILKINHDLAYKLEWHFRENDSADGIEKLEGMNDEIMSVFKECFINTGS